MASHSLRNLRASGSMNRQWVSKSETRIWWRVMLRAGLEWMPSIGNIAAYSSAAYPIGQVCLGRLSVVVLYGRGRPDPLSVHLA